MNSSWRAKERTKIILPIVFFVISLLLYMVFHNLTEAMVLIFLTFYAMTGGLILRWLLEYNFSVAVWVGISPSLASRWRQVSLWSFICTNGSTSASLQVARLQKPIFTRPPLRVLCIDSGQS